MNHPVTTAAVGTTLTRDGHSDTIDLRQVNAVWLAVALGAIPTG